ncbi:MAG: HslU--HslV peptidase proteolytic subunit, partial [Proteobacteria bacterium]|nr:HslU--HslV peptidase proteolytic subunit [Pseudomonadota bacterium]
MEIRGTTIIAVKDDNGTAMAGDGQVTLGQSVAMKHTARKVRRIYKDKVIIGFA